MQLVCPACGTNRIPYRCTIRSIPRLILFKGDAALTRLSGVVPAAPFTAWIRQHLPKGAV